MIFPQELEPRQPRDDEVDMFIDLEATREDHEEVRNLTFHDPFHTCVNFTNHSVDWEREGSDDAGREATWGTTAHP